jgi:putative flippase GtrA
MDLIARVARRLSELTGLPADWLRHYGGFVLAGGLGFAADAAALWLLTQEAGVSPFLARLVGIALGVLISWLVNRSVTFEATAPASFIEFVKYSTAAWSAQAVNYAVFGAVLLAWPQTDPMTAFVIACLVSIPTSYIGFRFGVFRHR